jgi:hypothetical protein
MRSPILCRERLNRILEILDRNNGTLCLRNFSRTHSIKEWELEQARNLGWIRIYEQKPRVGRPSRVAQKLSDFHTAKLPPFRRGIPKEISLRHRWFALHSVSVTSGGYFGFRMVTAVEAYLRAFPNARSRKAAYASASRLMKRRDVRVARLWYQRTTGLHPDESMPATVDAIIARLRELGLL